MLNNSMALAQIGISKEHLILLLTHSPTHPHIYLTQSTLHYRPTSPDPVNCQMTHVNNHFIHYLYRRRHPSTSPPRRRISRWKQRRRRWKVQGHICCCSSNTAGWLADWVSMSTRRRYLGPLCERRRVFIIPFPGDIFARQMFDIWNDFHEKHSFFLLICSACPPFSGESLYSNAGTAPQSTNPRLISNHSIWSSSHLNILINNISTTRASNYLFGGKCVPHQTLI